MSEPVALLFEPDGYLRPRDRVMGRHAAGEAFLRALALHLGDPIACFTDNSKKAQLFRNIAESHRTGAAGRWIYTQALAELGPIGCLFVPGPDLVHHARRRQRVGTGRFSLCGVTHTIASLRSTDAIADMLSGPLEPWDALICTSTAVHAAASQILQAEADYLRWRLDAKRFAAPQMPIIPLGVHCDDFDFGPDARARARHELGLDASVFVVLFVGRLSFHAKAHPLPMFEAAQALARDRRVALIQCGWYANDAIRASMQDLAQRVAPDVRMIDADGRERAARDRAWAAADMFCSLADNIQETFGLTPIEAMAAGLPVVVSDWNGYRDTVRDGVDGIRVPTLMPPAGVAEEIIDAHDADIITYDEYCGYTSQVVAVDRDATIAAMRRLADDRALRERMGAAGRRRAREIYDWKIIVGRYAELWRELARLRQVAPKSDQMPAPRVAARRIDPFQVYSGYPTRVIAPQDRVAPVPGAIELLHQRRPIDSLQVAKQTLLSEQDQDALLAALVKSGSLTMSACCATVPGSAARRTTRTLAWFAKLGIVVIRQPS